MKKSKIRNFDKSSLLNQSTLKRSDAILSVISDIKNKKINENTKNLVCLFGITPEELTESGLPYELLSSSDIIFL